MSVTTNVPDTFPVEWVDDAEDLWSLRILAHGQWMTTELFPREVCVNALRNWRNKVDMTLELAFPHQLLVLHMSEVDAMEIVK